MNKIIFAFAGDLASIVSLHWIESSHAGKVIAVTANLGQPGFLEMLGDIAMNLGASDNLVIDMRKKLLSNFAFRLLKAKASYLPGYYMSDIISKFLLATELVNAAREEGAQTIAIAANEESESFMRLTRTIHSIAPEMKITAPLKDLGLNTTQALLEYAQTHHIPIENIYQRRLNTDINLWGASIQVDNNPWTSIPDSSYVLTSPAAQIPDKPAEIELEFKSGLPVKLDNSITDPVSIVSTLNGLAGKYSVGRAEIFRRKFTGQISRFLCEAPAATVLYKAHEALEEVTMDPFTMSLSKDFSCRYAEMIFHGNWFSPAQKSLDSFFAASQIPVTGKVRVKFESGSFFVTGRMPYVV